MKNARVLGAILVFGLFTAGNTFAFKADANTTALWTFDSSTTAGMGFVNQVTQDSADPYFLTWSAAPTFATYQGTGGVTVDPNHFGFLPYHLDLTAGNTSKIISYGALMKLDTIRKDASSFIAGFYESPRFMIDTTGRIHVGDQNAGIAQPQTWGRLDEIAGQDSIKAGAWHEVVMSIDNTDPSNLRGYLFLDGKSVKNTGFSISNDGIRATGMSQFQIGQDPGNAGPPWYNGPMRGLLSQVIVEKGFIYPPPTDTVVIVRKKVNLGTKSVCAKPGDEIWVPIYLSNYSDDTISACQFILNIDTSVVEFISAQNDSGMVKDWALQYNNQGNKITLALGGVNTSLQYGDGELLRCQFRIKTTAAQNDFSNLELDSIQIDENKTLDVGSTTGTIKVGVATVLYGDVTGNGNVDLFDALKVFQYVVGNLQLPDSSASNFTPVIADVSGNGEITSYDGALIMQHSVGLLPQFPVESQALAKSAAVSSPGAGELTLSAPVFVSPGIYAYQLSGRNLQGMAAGEFQIGFDSAKIQSVTDITTSIRGANIATSVGSSRCLISLATNDDVGDTAVTVLTFHAAQADSASHFTLTTAYLNEGAIQGNFISQSIHASTLAVRDAPASLPQVSARFLHNDLEIFNPVQGLLTLRLFDISGHLVSERVLMSLGGQVLWIPMNGLKQGLYCYEVRLNNRAYRGVASNL